MTAAMVRARSDGAGPSPAANARMAEDLEVPRLLRLLLTAGWNLSESVGLPAAAYMVAAWLDGRDTGLVAGLTAIWLTAVIRKVATGTVPSLLTISAVVLTAQTAVVLATGELWLFLLQFPLANLCMCVLFARTASGPNPRPSPEMEVTGKSICFCQARSGDPPLANLNSPFTVPNRGNQSWQRLCALPRRRTGAHQERRSHRPHGQRRLARFVWQWHAGEPGRQPVAGQRRLDPAKLV